MNCIKKKLLKKRKMKTINPILEPEVLLLLLSRQKNNKNN